MKIGDKVVVLGGGEELDLEIGDVGEITDYATSGGFVVQFLNAIYACTTKLSRSNGSYPLIGAFQGLEIHKMGSFTEWQGKTWPEFGKPLSDIYLDTDPKTYFSMDSSGNLLIDKKTEERIANLEEQLKLAVDQIVVLSKEVVRLREGK